MVYKILFQRMAFAPLDFENEVFNLGLRPFHGVLELSKVPNTLKVRPFWDQRGVNIGSMMPFSHAHRPFGPLDLGIMGGTKEGGIGGTNDEKGSFPCPSNWPSWFHFFLRSTLSSMCLLCSLFTSVSMRYLVFSCLCTSSFMFSCFEK